MEATRKALAHMDDRRITDMGGLPLTEGSHVICLAMPKAQPCLSRVIRIQNDGMLTVSNGRTVRRVDPMSCILQAAN